MRPCQLITAHTRRRMQREWAGSTKRSSLDSLNRSEWLNRNAAPGALAGDAMDPSDNRTAIIDNDGPE
jgi:hypothetical protein